MSRNEMVSAKAAPKIFFVNHLMLSKILWLIPVFIFTALTILGAQIKIPLPWTPIPITLQTFFVLLSGAAIGGVRGSLSQVFYILLGSFGLPVFAGSGAGFGYLLGPTGGYLVGFVVAPLMVNFLFRDCRSFPRVFFSLWIGSLLIFGCGLAHLVFFHSFSWGRAASVGFFPFITGDLTKIFFSTLYVRYFVWSH